MYSYCQGLFNVGVQGVACLRLCLQPFPVLWEDSIFIAQVSHLTDGPWGDAQTCQFFLPLDMTFEAGIDIYHISFAILQWT